MIKAPTKPEAPRRIRLTFGVKGLGFQFQGLPCGIGQATFSGSNPYNRGVNTSPLIRFGFRASLGLRESLGPA